MAKPASKIENEAQPVDPRIALKELLMKRAKDIFEREPQNAFVFQHLDTLVEDIISIFN